MAPATARSRLAADRRLRPDDLRPAEPDDFKVSETLQGYFANVIKTGNPYGAGLPQWPVGTVGADGQVRRMRVDVESRAEPEPRARYLFQDQARAAARP